MKIYLDLVIIINYIFDLILLISVNYILKRNKKLFRLILSSLTGSITLVILFVKMSNIILLLLKFITSIIMLITAFGYQDIRYLSKNIVYFYLVSMLLGGGIYFLNNQFTYTNNGLSFTPHSLAPSYFITIIFIGIFLFTKYIKSLNYLKTNYHNYYPCKIYFDQNNIIEVTAFLDTGNHLVDPITKKSIILIDQNLYHPSNTNPLYIPYNTLNTHGLLTCYKAEKIEIEGRCCQHFLVGISTEKLHFDGINCIINSRIMEELK